MAAASEQPHEGECAVCTSDFTTPKILPCGHLLCRECVISWIHSKPNTGCPLCRCPIVRYHQRSHPPDHVVDSLPTDFVMEALAEAAHILHKDWLCCVCEDVKADVICMQCQDLMCSSCSKMHKKMSMSRSHDVESLSTVTPERLAASRPALCADHGDKHALFCVQHQLSLCLCCSVIQHRGCTQVTELGDQMKICDSLLGDLIDTLSSAEHHLEQVIGQVDSRLQDIDAGEREDIVQLDKIFGSLHKAVEACHTELKERTRLVHSKVRKPLQEVKTALGSRLGQATSHKHIVTRARAVAPPTAVIKATKALIDRVKSLDLKADMRSNPWASLSPSLAGSFTDELLRIEKELQVLVGLKKQDPTCYKTPEDSKNVVTWADDEELVLVRPGEVASYEPLKPNILYLVRLDENNWKGISYNFLHYGVSEDNPFLDSSEVEEEDYCLSKRISWTTTGSVAGLMIDFSKTLHFFLDGLKIDRRILDSSQSCFAFFKFDPDVQVTILPVVKKDPGKRKGRGKETIVEND